MSDKEDLVRRALARIENSSDPKELGRIADNAGKAGNQMVRQAALRKRYAISPSAQPGTLEHAVWQSFYAL